MRSLIWKRILILRLVDKSVDIENDFEYVFNKEGEGEGKNFEDFSDGESAQGAEDAKRIGKKRIQKKKKELAIEDENNFEEDILNN